MAELQPPVYNSGAQTNPFQANALNDNLNSSKIFNETYGLNQGTQYGYAPDPSKTKPGDTILYGPNVTAQNPFLLRLQNQDATRPELDGSGKEVGVRVTKPYFDKNAHRQAAQQEGDQYGPDFAQAQQDQIQPGFGESNDIAAQRMGYADARDARHQGATFALGADGRPGSPGTQQNEIAQDGSASAFSQRRDGETVGTDQDTGLSTIKDIFGKPITRQTLMDQARNNLFASLRGTGKSTGEINAEVERILSGSTDSQLDKYRKSQGLPTDFGAVNDQDIELGASYGIGEQDIINASTTITSDNRDQSEAILDAQTASLKRIEEMLKLELAQISEDYGEAQQETRDTGGRLKGSLKRILGRAGGFTTSAGGQAMVAQENSLTQQINKLKAAESRAKSKASMNAETSVGTIGADTQDALASLREEISTAQNQRARLLLDMMGEMRLQRKDKREAEEVDAIDPFFSGSNIISLMKALPAGVTEEIMDPNTQEVFTVTGLKDPATYSVTSDNGTVRILRKSDGSVVSQTEAGIGKTKTRAANISMNIRKEIGGLIAAASEVLEANRGIDTKTNPAIYEQQMNLFIRAQGGTADDFKDYFPPETYLSTDDPNSLKFFVKPSSLVEDAGISNADLAA